MTKRTCIVGAIEESGNMIQLFMLGKDSGVAGLVLRLGPTVNLAYPGVKSASARDVESWDTVILGDASAATAGSALKALALLCTPQMLEGIMGCVGERVRVRHRHGEITIDIEDGNPAS
jgi:hypothetical protein